nr:hypothetical protein CFP56_19481 [Quercus suber]
MELARPPTRSPAGGLAHGCVRTLERHSGPHLLSSSLVCRALGGRRESGKGVPHQGKSSSQPPSLPRHSTTAPSSVVVLADPRTRPPARTVGHTRPPPLPTTAFLVVTVFCPVPSTASTPHPAPGQRPLAPGSDACTTPITLRCLPCNGSIRRADFRTSGTRHDSPAPPTASRPSRVALPRLQGVRIPTVGTVQ